jgi:diguanylate cyclase (GGDEF)-like protein
MPRRADPSPRAPRRRPALSGPRRLAALNRIARLASEDLELRPMLQRVCDGLAEMFDWEFVACLRIDAGRQRLICGGLATRLPTELEVGYPRPLWGGVVGRVATTGEPALLDDVAADADYFPAVEGVRSELCVPIQRAGDVVAVLDVESTRPAAFHGQLPLLEAVAEQIAGAIAGAQRYEEALRRARLLEILQEASQTALGAGEPGALLERIVTYLEERFGFPVVEAVLIDDRGGRFSLRASTGSGASAARVGDSWPLAAGGIVGRALRTGETQLVADVAADPEYVALAPDVCSELVVPIRFQDRTLGAFNFESGDRGVFTPEICALLQLLASQVAGAVHLTALNRRLARTRDQLAAANRALRAVNRDLENQSRTDSLTGCGNRRAFEDSLQQEWRRAFRAEAALALLLVDIDFFKPLNDARGHREGDRCLRRVAQTLAEAANRAGDLVARYGGDEFVLLLPGLERRALLEFAERIRSTVEALGLPHGGAPAGPVVTVSVGAASQRPHRGGSPETLFTAADRSLLEAKRHGRNTVVGAGEAAR